MKFTKKMLVDKFISILEDNGDIFFSTGSVTKDYNYITGVLKLQGYYAGIEYRYYLDNEMNLIDMVNRYF